MALRRGRLWGAEDALQQSCHDAEVLLEQLFCRSVKSPCPVRLNSLMVAHLVHKGRLVKCQETLRVKSLVCTVGDEDREYFLGGSSSKELSYLYTSTVILKVK